MDKREFQFEEGTSRKFWSVQTEGAEMTVHYGRIGTTGQAQKKTFADAAAADREANKLIAEKTKKGYAEVAGGGAGTVMPVAAVARPREMKKPAEPETAADTGASVPDPSPTTTAPLGSAAPKSSAAKLARSIRLDPEDHFVRTWEAHAAPAPETEPLFDFASGIERLRAVSTGENGWERDWRRARIPAWPSKAEAAFWLVVGKRLENYSAHPKDVAEKLSKDYSDSEAAKQASRVLSGEVHNDLFVGCALRLMTLEQILSTKSVRPAGLGEDAARILRERVIPRLPESERSELRQRLSGVSVPRPVPIGRYFAPPWPAAAQLQAMLGMHAEVEANLRQLPDGVYGSSHPAFQPYTNEQTQWLVFGLGSAERVRDEFARLGLTLDDPEQARAWLALTGFEALDEITKSTCTTEQKEYAVALAKVLLRVQAPEAAGPALLISRESKAQVIGLEWLQKFPFEAAVGLVPVAMGQGKLATAAREHLELMHSGRTIPAETTDHLTPAEATWLQENILSNAEESIPVAALADLPEALRDALGAVKSPKPTFVPAAALPALRVGATRLGVPEIDRILHVLKAAALEDRPPLFAALREHAERHSLDLFAWKLFSLWDKLGAPTKEKWALAGIGHLGGDQCVLKLTPLVRNWPGESQHARAVLGLQCLRMIGTDTALMALNGIAQKLKFKGLQEKAKVLMEEIAASRGFTREQLADRIVPDCDLDARGSRVFDFGPRQFTFVLGPEMKPLVRDATGKVRPDLPTPNQSDDAAKAEDAVNGWKLLKKTLREVLKVQAERLEDAMISGRRWTAAEFRTLLVEHPLMVNLVRLLVCAAYDAEGRAVQTFRVTEDQSLADQNDESVAEPATDRIGVVHPAHLDPGALGAWGQVFADYALIPPFPQLGRPICHPEPTDLKLTAITRFKGPRIPGIVLFGMLERSHWTRDLPEDGGGFAQHSKYFQAADVTAFIAYEPGMAVSYYEEPQQVSEIYFVAGHVKPDWWGEHKNRRRVGEVDSVVLSEVLRLAHALVSKAE